MQTVEQVESGLFAGERIGDLDRDGLLTVISYLANELEETREAHRRTLSVWSMARKARAA